jgi:hypothetical protein
VDGDTVIIKGLAANLLSFKGYRVGVLKSSSPASVTPWLDMNSDELKAADWEFLPLPDSYYCNCDTDPTLSVIQVSGSDGALARWPIANMSNDGYQVGLFVFGLAEGIASATTVIDAAVVGDVTVATPAGLRNLTASPASFRTQTALQVAAYGTSSVTFRITDLAGAYDASLPGVAVPDTPLFRADYAPPPGTFAGPTALVVTARDDAGVLDPVTGSAFYVDESLIGIGLSATITGDGLLVASGSAFVEGFDVLSGWELTAEPDGGGAPVSIASMSIPAKDEVIGKVDSALLNATGVTLRLSVKDTAGNEKVQAEWIRIPLMPVLKVAPTVLTPNGDGKGDEATIEVKLNQPIAGGTMSILPPGGGPAVKTEPLPSSGSAAYIWNGGTSSDGDYTVRVVATPASGGADEIRTAEIMLRRTAVEASDIISASTSPIPRPYFDLPVRGSGLFDIPFDFTWSLKKAGTGEDGDVIE